MIVEMFERLVSDRLWIYTSIVGSVFGALFLMYMRGTRIGLWVYSKWDGLLDFIRDRLGWSWFDQPDDAWRKLSPKIAKKIDELEVRIQELEK